MKKYLIVYYGDAPECVEGFSKDCKRSCKGALHVKPSRQMTITEDEMNHLKKKYGHVMPKLRVLSEMEDKPEKGKASEKKPELSKEQPKEEATADSQEGKKTTKKTSRRNSRS